MVLFVFRLRYLYTFFSEKVQADMRRIMVQKECYQKCDYVQYETEVEFIENRQGFK